MKRNEFVEEIGEYDDDIGELVINEKEVKSEDLKNAIRRIVLDSKALITFCGSAYKVRISWEGQKSFQKITHIRFDGLEFPPNFELF